MADGVGVALVKVALGEPHVEVDAEAVQRLAHVGDHQLDATAGESVDVHVGGPFDLARQVRDVVAAVAVLGHLLAARPRQDRLAQLAHLAAVVVDVELARDLMAVEGQQAGQRVAVRRVARVPHVHRAGRVGGDELDVDALAHGRAPAAEGLARVEDGTQRVAEPLVAQPQVQKARAGDLDAVQPAAEAPAQLVAEPLGDVARRRLEHRREQHRGVGGVVAEVGALGALQRWRVARAAIGERRGRLGDGRAKLVERGRHLSDGRARWRGSCGRGRAARGARPARAGAGASAARTTAGGRWPAPARSGRR